MNLKPLVKICLLCLLPVMTMAQKDPTWGFVTDQQADSLKRSLKTEKNDTLLMAANRSLGFYYQETKLDSGLYFHQQQLKLAKKLSLKMWLADAYSQVGYLLGFMGNTAEGYDNFMEAKKIADDEKNESSNWHPWVFSNSKNLHDARLSILAMNYNGLGGLYYDMGEPKKGMDALKEILRIGEQTRNGKILATVYANMAERLSPDSSIQYLKKAIKYEDESGYKKNRGSTLLRIASIFGNKKEFDSAVHYCYASMQANLEQNNMRLLVNSYRAMVDVHKLLKNPDSSLFYAKKTLEAARTTGQPGSLLTAYKALSNANQLNNKIDSAFKYEQLANNLNDSLKKARIDNLTKYQKSSFDEQLRLKKLDEEKTAYANRMNMLGLLAVLGGILVVAIILYRNNRQKQKANKVLETTLTNLKSTQSQLIQSEKMASLGELTAGIAHEIQNPLNFVNNFSEVNTELIDEMKIEMDKGNIDDAKAIANDIKENEQKINHHGKRADAIVKGMLQHSSSGSGKKEPTDINKLADEYLRLAYHGLRAKDKSFNATMKTDYDESIGNINIVPQDIGRVILNLITNAFYAVDEKKKKQPDYEPVVTVSTKRLGSPLGSREDRREGTEFGGKIEIKVADNGNGISPKVLDKIFQPFFTTKPVGEGTGLGLSLSYDIIKAHGGELKVETKEGEGAEFIIILPV